MKVLAKDIMQQQVKTVRPELPLPDLEKRFVDDGVSGFPVVDQQQNVLGVVTATDVLQHLCEERRNLESSVGFYDDSPHASFDSLSDEWISAEIGKRADHLVVADVMNDDVISLPPTASLHDVAALMSDMNIHRILVVDAGHLVGILTSLDVVRACGNDDIDITFVPPPILDF